MSGTRTILLTGAGRGLGRAMTHALVELGHTVYGCSRSAASVSELQKTYTAPHHFAQVDVSQEREVAAWAANIASRSVPDLLLNNAAVINDPAPLWEITPSDFDALINVNIKGVYYVIHHFLPSMISQGRGIIVNFSSGWGRSTAPEVAPYCASKWAIEGLTQALASELPEGLAAVALNPGIICTDMLKTCFGGQATQYSSPQQWAQASVPFLLSLSTQQNGSSLTAPA